MKLKLKAGKLNRVLIPAGGLLVLAAVILLLLPGKTEEPSAPVDIPCVEVDGEIGVLRLSLDKTSAAEYQRLREACVARHTELELAHDTSSGNTIEVSEETFVDAGPAMDVTSVNTCVEGESVCFNGVLLVRYAGSAGTHMTLAAFSETDGKTSVVSVEELTGGEFRAPLGRPEDAAEQPDVLYEDEFLRLIGKCVTALMSGGEAGEITNLCVTDSGRSALQRVGIYAGADENSQPAVIFAVVGSTGTEGMQADRVLLRCEVGTVDGTVSLDLLLKLNQELRIYDVDLL